MQCPYCGGQVKLLPSSEKIYGRDYGPVYTCEHYPACNSYVGCHKGTTRPLGTVANHQLRELRKACHALFDPLWKTNQIDKLDPGFIPGESSRDKAYRWITEQLLLPEQFHIAQADEQLCRRAITVLKVAYQRIS